MLLILFDEVKDDEDLRNVGVANIAKELKDAAEKLLDYKNKVSDWPHETEDCEKTMKRRDEVVKHISEFERCRAHVNDYVAALSRTQKERKKKSKLADRRAEWKHKNLVDVFAKTPRELAEAFAAIDSERTSIAT